MQDHVFITGATGVIGSALVPLYLKDPGTVVHLLIRGESDRDMARRLDSLFEEWRATNDVSSWTGRVHAHRGDIALPRLGLDDGGDALAAVTTRVVHCAANVRMNLPLAEARRTAAGATAHVLEFVAAGLDAGALRKFDYVSTLGVAGRLAGAIPERPLRHEAGFHNTYEQAKAEAEQMVIEKLDAGWPLSIHRPSMVVGDSRTGRVRQFQVFYYLVEYLTGRKTWGLVPRLGDYKLDLVPVDYVARAIYLCSMDNEAVGRLFHLCSGPDHAVPISEVTAVARTRFAERGIAMPGLTVISPQWYRRWVSLAAMLAMGRLHRRCNALKGFLDYLGTDQVFENAMTRQFLEARGLPLPAPAGYLDRLILHYIEKRQLSQ